MQAITTIGLRTAKSGVVDWVEAEAIVWALDQETYQRIYKSEPGLAAALLTYVVQLQGERLSFTTRQIAALQR
jgi:hypothetical protein